MGNKRSGSGAGYGSLEGGGRTGPTASLGTATAIATSGWGVAVGVVAAAGGAMGGGAATRI